MIRGIQKELSGIQVQEVIQDFVSAAKVAQNTGFDGVEIHAAHGYLLRDFLSADSNQRTDN